jgi:hypothetical protein
LNAFEKGAAMEPKVWMYLAYLAISIGLTIWVATTLARNGLVFLQDVFADSKLATSVNQLLVMGFYLLNLGFVTVAMRSSDSVPDASRALETLSWKVGFVLLVLGALHFFNVFALNRYRRGRLRQHAERPPLPPTGRLPIMQPAGWSGPPLPGPPLPGPPQQGPPQQGPPQQGPPARHPQSQQQSQSRPQQGQQGQVPPPAQP